MSLVRLTWGGTIYSANSGGSAVEIWSNSLSLLGPANPAPTNAEATTMYNLLATFHAATATRIDATVSLDWAKLAEVDVLTGIQISDPTPEWVSSTPPRGDSTVTVKPALTTSARISMDNSSRDPSKRGGFFIPRYAGTILGNGRFDSTQIAALSGSATALISGINAALSAKYDVGIWSRKNGSVTVVNRIRVGDVPDNISYRKNALPETYVVTNP